MPFTATLFPGKIELSPNRSVSEILADWIDTDGNLILSPDIKIPPSRTEPMTKLVFRKSISPNDGSVIFSFLGSTNRIDTYTQLADFSYTPPDPQRHIYTQSISKQTNPQQYNFECNPSVSLIEAKLAAKEELGDVSSVAFLRFRDKDAPPEQPTPYMLNQQQDDELVRKVKELFIARPIWQRAALEEALGDDKAGVWRLSHAIRLASYLFLDGPWRKCYVRFGYDPRTDSNAKRLQMIDFRDPFLKAGGDDTKGGNPDIHFRKPPSNRSQLYQLCDIEDPGIQALLAGETKRVSADPHTGWLTDMEIDSIRNQMKIKSESMRRHVS